MLKDIISAMLCLVLLLALVTGICLVLDQKTCEEKTRNIGLPHTWSPWTSCMINQDGDWIPLENWRYIGNIP